MSDNKKTLEQLEDEAGAFLAMPKDKYDEFVAKKKTAKVRARREKK
jgi:hypothetical protein